MANILIIDDDPQMAYSLARAAKMHGHEIQTAGSLGEAREHLGKGQGHDLVFLDVRLPDGSGLDFLSSLRTTGSQPSIIVLTGYGEPEGAEKAITKGAWDYIEKTSSIDQIALSMCRALDFRKRRLEQKKTLLRRSTIIGDSPVIQEALEQVGLAAASDTSVLVTGETGTGKELFSRAIHANSPRSHAPFVVVDCGSIRDTLAESILFGHAKGAFTGAHQSTEGLIAKAEGGTLFLDEVGELPLEIQKSLLRVLEDHTFRPIGSTIESKVDFRIVAATNQDLRAMVQEGGFREDLLFRLQAIHLEIPPLRKRREDLRSIASHHLQRRSEDQGSDIKGMSREFIGALYLYDWPGNVRELIHCVDYACGAARLEPTLYPEHLPTHIRAKVAGKQVKGSSTTSESPVTSVEGKDGLPLFKEYRKRAVERAERKYLEQLLETADWSIKDACALSGLSRTRLYTLMKAHNLQRSE